MGLNFTMNLTWEDLIRLSLSKKRPKNLFPDTRVAGYLWLSQCTVAPTAFWKCVFWDTLYFTQYFAIITKDICCSKIIWDCLSNTKYYGHVGSLGNIFFLSIIQYNVVISFWKLGLFFIMLILYWTINSFLFVKMTNVLKALSSRKICKILLFVFEEGSTLICDNISE